MQYEQWGYPDNAPDWDEIGKRFGELTNKVNRVWAPLYEENGHAHHNMISLLARQAFPRLTFYSTYTYDGGKSTVGDRVQPVNGWVQRKREAMACYVTQATHHNTHLPFDTWAIDEYTL